MEYFITNSKRGKITFGFFNSFGLMQRTKKGWQADSVRIKDSRDFLNWMDRVDAFLRESALASISWMKRTLRNLLEV